jgi:hypothetical protein
MTPLHDLWMPIAVSALALFFLGFLFWMVLPHHRSDWTRLPDEDGVMADLTARGVQGPGQFSFPHCGSPDVMKDPEFIKKMEAGPSGMLVLMKPGPLAIGKSMVHCVIHNAVVAAVVAYAAGLCLAPGAAFGEVFRLVGTIGILAWCSAAPSASIWFHHKWSATWKTILDGAVFGLAMGAIFAWLWPSVG